MYKIPEVLTWFQKEKKKTILSLSVLSFYFFCISLNSSQCFVFCSDNYNSSLLSQFVFSLQSNSSGLRWCQQLYHCQPDCEQSSGLSSGGECRPKSSDHPASEFHHPLWESEHR